jgi:hypothetical protein
METFKKIKEEGDKQIKKTNVRIKGSEDWKKYQDKKSEWLETIKRHQDAAMKNK